MDKQTDQQMPTKVQFQTDFASNYGVRDYRTVTLSTELHTNIVII